MRTVSLEFATNLFGSIRPEIRQTLERVIAKPNQKTWEDAYCIILSGEGKMPTLWQAVRGIDPSFCCCKGMDEP
jgi:glutathionylspermidine synthase